MISLAQLLGKPIPCEEFLRLAILITQEVAQLHERYLVHKNLKPQNIFVDLKRSEASLKGFELAAPLATGRLIVGTLAYMSPEQIGKLKKDIDHRSDLYSLGIIFFEMLSGTLPFDGEDALEWAYNHVAVAPKLTQLKELQIPDVVISLIGKLLAKSPEDRYQSAVGLIYDLQRCLNSLLQNGSLIDFSLGEKDISSQLVITSKLYGREFESETLLQCYKKVVRHETPELVLVSGYSGIGKSSLVNELHEPIAMDRGRFVFGKFDQLKKDSPYYTFFQSLSQLILDLLLEKESQVQLWAEKIRAQLKENAKLIINVVPELEFLIGPQPAVSELPPAEAQARFRRVFLNFIKIFTSSEDKLTFFLDDLQWADMASLELIRELVTSKDIGRLLLIGAYRDNEITTMHPLSLLIKELKKNNAALLTEIVLGPLSKADLNKFLAETLNNSENNVLPLSEVIYLKTGGNPFFVKQFLTAMNEEGLLVMDHKQRKWSWNLEKIQKKGFTDNVADLVMRKIRRLPDITQKALQLASCFGNTVSVDDYSHVFNVDQEELRKSFFPAVGSHIIGLENNILNFSHDRLQEVAYSLASSEQRALTHLHIARSQLARFSPDEISVRIFEIVGQFAHAHHLLSDNTEKMQVAELHLLAAQRAQMSTAFAMAAKYSAQGLELLSVDGWQEHYRLTFDLTLLQAKAELASGQMDAAQKAVVQALQNAKGEDDQALAQHLQIQIHTGREESEKALAAAIQFLKKFDLDLKPHPSPEEVNHIEAQVWQVIHERGLQSVAELHEIAQTKKAIDSAIAVLVEMLPSSYFTDLHLHRLVSCHIILLTFQHGLGLMSPMGFSAFAIELVVAKKIQEAAAFSDLAIQLARRPNLRICFSKVAHVCGSCILPWTRSLAEAMDLLRENIATGLGDVVFVSLSQWYLELLEQQSGKKLLELKQEIDKALSEKVTGYNLVYDGKLILNKFIVTMIKGLNDKQSLFEDTHFLDLMKNHPIPQMNVWVTSFQLQAAVYFGQWSLADKVAQEMRQTVIYLRGQQPEFILAFFHALVLTQINDAVTPELREYQTYLAQWAAMNPKDFLSAAALVDAEVARLEKNSELVQQKYEIAIKSARQQNQIHTQALASEFAARHYQNCGLELVSQTYQREAIRSYLAWGAESKAHQLRQIFPVPLSDTWMGQPEQIDLIAALKASQAISSEIVLDQLIPTLLKIVLEQSGARKGALCLFQKHALKLEALAWAEDDGTISSQQKSVELDTAQNIPTSIIRYVQRTHETIIMGENNQYELRFSTDEYIKAKHPLSALCLPIVRGSHFLGVLYLENNLTPGVFSKDRLNVLKLISAQAAISLQNALSVQMRDEFISIASHELRTPLTPLKMSLDILKKALESITSAQFPKIGDVLKTFQNTYKAVDRLSVLTEELLNASSIASGRLTLNLQKTDISQLVTGVLARYTSELQKNHYQVTTSIPENILTLADPHRIEQVVENLLKNAIKYGNKQPIFISVEETGQKIKIHVQDHGIGIAEENQKKIFDRFERAVPVTSYGGLGLGLYICKELVLAHGGNISVRSQLGLGSTFTVELPLRLF